MIFLRWRNKMPKKIVDTTLSFTVEEINAIIQSYVMDNYADANSKVKVNYRIKESTGGDYEDYEPAKVSEIVVTY